MRPLPLNLRDTYGHVRMAVYSAGLDVEIRSADHLSNGMMGCYSERTRTILIDRPRIQFVSATLVFGLAAFDCSLAISSSHTSLGVL